MLKSLPVAGKSGTLKNVAAHTAANGRIHAKSGTLDRIKCFAGIVHAKSGARFAFALMINHYTGTYAPVKAGIEGVMAAMAGL